MHAAALHSTPRLKRIKGVMHGGLAVPRKRPDEMVAKAMEESPPNDDPYARTEASGT
jgi:hypothetical protein